MNADKCDGNQECMKTAKNLTQTAQTVLCIRLALRA